MRWDWSCSFPASPRSRVPSRSAKPAMAGSSTIEGLVIGASEPRRHSQAQCPRRGQGRLQGARRPRQEDDGFGIRIRLLPNAGRDLAHDLLRESPDEPGLGPRAKRPGARALRPRDEARHPSPLSPRQQRHRRGGRLDRFGPEHRAARYGSSSWLWAISPGAT